MTTTRFPSNSPVSWILDHAKAEGCTLYLGPDARVTLRRNGRTPSQSLIHAIRAHRHDLLLTLSEITGEERQALAGVEYDLAVGALLWRRVFDGRIVGDAINKAVST